MGINLITALEIFGHPNDLEISVCKGKNSEKFGILICRGPGHDFKLLISSDPFAKTVDDAVQEVRKILDLVCKASRAQLEKGDQFVNHVINPDGEKVDNLNALRPDLIDRIIKDLQKTQIASTYKYQ